MTFQRRLHSHSFDPPYIGGRLRSSVGFSYDEVNCRGNFDLYQVPCTGGEPVALTSPPRHELSPEVSADGPSIAFASNWLGSMDLFRMPTAGGDAELVRIEGPRSRGSSGRIRVTMVGELDRPTAAQQYVESSDGKGYAPRGEPIFYYPLEPGVPRDAFLVAVGSAEFHFPVCQL